MRVSHIVHNRHRSRGINKHKICRKCCCCGIACWGSRPQPIRRNRHIKKPRCVLFHNRLGTTTPWWTLRFRFFDPLCGTEISCPRLLITWFPSRVLYIFSIAQPTSQLSFVSTNRKYVGNVVVAELFAGDHDPLLVGSYISRY